MALHQVLWARNADLAQACLDSSFVRGLADGSLAADSFRRYVAQDAFFLSAFFSAYALAAARTSDRIEVARRLHALMQGVLEELELHRAYAERLDIDLEAVTPNAAAKGYTDFLARTAWNAKAGEILAAMTPCMRLYAWLGRRLTTGDHAGNPYRDWIETYASPDFEGLAAELERLLDDLAADMPERAAEAYAEAMRHELAFFETFAE
ncbi:MAG: TenA family protein [Gemmatimonadota bacterium]|nr:TenA family protein [Gemmatimonadota bacterium]MDE2983121.1 TenA family protein [Gemmatimonadota bacterium]